VRVDSLTCSGEFKHRETVAVDTAARFATSSNVGTERVAISVLP